MEILPPTLQGLPRATRRNGSLVEGLQAGRTRHRSGHAVPHFTYRSLSATKPLVRGGSRWGRHVTSTSAINVPRWSSLGARVMGPLEDALNEPALSDPQRQRLELAHRNCLRMLKRVNSLLEFSRIDWNHPGRSGSGG